MTARLHLSTRERARLFALHGGVCHLCEQRIDGTREPWDVEHVIPVALIGRSAETDDNRKPAHRRCHRLKTKGDVTAIAKAKRREARHIGTKAPSRTPLPGGKGDYRKRTFRGWVNRYTGEPL